MAIVSRWLYLFVIGSHQQIFVVTDNIFMFSLIVYILPFFGSVQSVIKLSKLAIIISFGGHYKDSGGRQSLI